MSLSHTKVFLLRSEDCFGERLSLSAKQVVSDGTIGQPLNEYRDQHKFTDRVHYHAACKVAYMLSVSVNLTLTLFDSEEFR